MKDLVLSVVLMFGMAWWAGEGVVRVANGSWLTFGLFFVIFTVALVTLGCTSFDNAKIDRLGAVFAAIITLALLVFAVQALTAEGGSVFKLVLAVAFGAAAVPTMLRARGSAAHT